MSTSAPQTVSVVIPTHNTRDMVLVAVASAMRQRPAPLEVIVVDDYSSDGTSAAVNDLYPTARVLRNEENLLFSASANRGLTAAQGEILLLLNSDAELLDGSIDVITGALLSDPALAVVGAELLYPDGSPQWSGGSFPGPAWLFALTSGIAVQAARLPAYRRLKGPGNTTSDSVEWVSGAALGMTRNAWLEFGPFDEGYRFYAQDMDLCRRAANAEVGVEILPGFRAIHHHGASITATHGSAGLAHPDLLWSDLLRFVAIHDGLAAARRSRQLMLIGAWLRITGRRILSPLIGSGRSTHFKDETAAYQRAASTLRNSSLQNMIASAGPRL